jgi:flavodoxin
MKTIIVYYSNTKNNEILAHDLQKKLSCDILKIEEIRKRTGFTIFLDLLFNRMPKIKDHGVPLELYENFIFVAPIWMGKIASPLKSFLFKEKERVNSYSFISLCGGVKGQATKIKKELEAILQQESKVVEELWLNQLLASERMNTVKHTSGYRVLPADLENFKEQIDEFVRQNMQPNVRHHELRY